MGKHDIEFISFPSKLLAGLIEATKEMNSLLEKGLAAASKVKIYFVFFHTERMSTRKDFPQLSTSDFLTCITAGNVDFGSMCNNFNIFLTHQ